jgi:hypothetical protein
MIIANVFVGISNIILSMTLSEEELNFSKGILGFIGCFGILNVIFAIAIFKFKKWGFYVFCASAAIVFVINLSAGISLINALIGLFGIVVLFAVLNIGKENKAWPQLE